MPNPTKELKKRLKTQAKSFYDEDGLKTEGFPPKLVKAFLETADNLDCVILSRTPGRAATQLITEGYDLKGYEIKSKSCNWGPMAGFLCRIPPLNKNGVEKIKYNYGYLKSYVDTWKKKAKPGTSAKYQIKDLFQPIKISDVRKKEIFDSRDSYGMGHEKSEYIKLKKDRIYGICSTTNIENKYQVVMDYLLIQEPLTKLWMTYLGVILFFKDKKNYTGNEPPDFFVEKKAGKQGDSEIERKITQLQSEQPIITIQDEKHKSQIINLRHKKLGLRASEYGFKGFNFCPIEGAVNPYPPYPDSYKNCVTGDYDLFACWPKTTFPLQELIRQAEFSLGKENYFSSFGKSLTLGLRPAGAFNHIYIEFIPGVPAINDLEDPEKGNINDLTELVAGTLNSIAGVALENGKTYANKAFHSDEGGRPKIDDIEFPVAYFLPESIRKELFSQKRQRILPKYAEKFQKKGGGVINNINEFLEFISICAENGHRVTLSHGWFIFLITHALNNEERKKIKLPLELAVEEKASNYFKKYSCDKTKPPIAFQAYRDKVLKFLLGYYTLDGNKKKRYQAKDSFLMKVAGVFIPFLDMDESDKSKIREKVQTAKSIVYDANDFTELT
jgi:hypothetical protein